MNDEDVKRYVDIVVQKVGDQIQVIAEGHVMLAHRFDRVDARLDSMDGRLTRVEADVLSLRHELRVVKEDVQAVKEDVQAVKQDVQAVKEDVQAVREEARGFRAEVAREFGEVKAMIKLSYSELDGRLRSLEHEVGDLRTRLERLEARVPAGAVS